MTDLVIALLIVFGVLGIILTLTQRLMLAALCVIGFVIILVLSATGVLVL